MSHNSLKERISVEAIAHHRKRQIHQFGDYCYLTQQLLMSNPQGLKKHKVQSAIGISEKTASRVLAWVAIEKDGKYFINSL